VKAWFGDMGDGKRDGSATDPRVGVIVVKPYEVSSEGQRECVFGLREGVLTMRRRGFFTVTLSDSLLYKEEELALSSS
jgi:hypothetical protein